jgi:hypothetical protein
VAILISTPFGIKQIRISKHAYMVIIPTINRGDNSISDFLRVKTNKKRNIKESKSKKIVRKYNIIKTISIKINV